MNWAIAKNTWDGNSSYSYGGYIKFSNKVLINFMFAYGLSTANFPLSYTTTCFPVTAVFTSSSSVYDCMKTYSLASVTWHQANRNHFGIIMGY